MVMLLMTCGPLLGGAAKGYHEHLKVNNKPVQMKLDTRTAVSMMSHQQWKIITNGQPVRPDQGKPLRGCLGHKVKVVGQVDVNVEYEGNKYNYHCSENTSQHCLAVIGSLLSS